MGAPREDQSLAKDRTSSQDTRRLQQRLQQVAMQYLSLATGLLRLWQAFPPDVQREIVRLMGLS